MKFEVVLGKNNKVFVQLSDVVTKQDIELIDVIKNVCSRTDYFPFKQGFNKTAYYSYFINETFFPIQFWKDVKAQLINFIPDVHLVNEDLLYSDIYREEFDEFINSFKFPEEIIIEDETYKFQQDSAYLSLYNKTAKIEIGTSGGKTFITYLYCKYLYEKVIKLIDKDKKILIVVPSKLLCQQLQSDFKIYEKYIENKLIVETVFSGAMKYIGANVVVGTYQSLSNYDEDYFNDFFAFVCDEAHMSKAYSIKNEIFNKIKFAEYSLAMSGTFPDKKKLDYLHIVSMFGATVFTKEAYELIESGISTPILIQAIRINYDEDINYSINLIESGIVGREKYMEEKRFFHNHKGRTEILCKLLKNLEGNALILVDTVEYCHILYDYLTEYCSNRQFGIIHGNVDNRSDIIDDMKTIENYCIIGTYGTMSTGISINNILYCFFPDGGKSEIRIRQSIGRGMRKFLNKKLCQIFDFQDMIPRCSFKNHALTRNGIYHRAKFPIKFTNIKI